jgi:hypothetical protein
MIEAKCSSCGRRLEKGEERIVIALFDLDFNFDSEYGFDFAPELAPVSHCCSECAGNIDEFRVPNPWKKPPEDQQPDTVERPSSQLHGAVIEGVAKGDMRHFNAAFPERAPASDALAHSVQSYPADEANATASATVPALGDMERKRRLLQFLNDPRSRGVIRPEARDVARRWAQGETQTDIAKAKNMNQATVSRLLKAVLEAMNKKR